jgi:hypothetical protein
METESLNDKGSLSDYIILDLAAERHICFELMAS